MEAVFSCTQLQKINYIRGGGGGEGRVGGQCSINKEIIKCCEEK